MPEQTKKRTNDDEKGTDTSTLNDTCGNDIKIITDGHLLENGIVELTDKKEYIDEP